ncbi:hypothetical protein D6783_04385 [Candidatus Woesearchaeota archaeon]|nr:MAG: hypothetical protein D6783_04385 [Candidatus Woesearchaeota archaeon]
MGKIPIDDYAASLFKAVSYDAPTEEESGLSLLDFLRAEERSPEELAIVSDLTEKVHTLLLEMAGCEASMGKNAPGSMEHRGNGEASRSRSSRKNSYLEEHKDPRRSYVLCRRFGIYGVVFDIIRDQLLKKGMIKNIQNTYTEKKEGCGDDERVKAYLGNGESKSWQRGKNSKGERTLREIGDELGISRERVRQLENEGLLELRVRLESIVQYTERWRGEKGNGKNGSRNERVLDERLYAAEGGDRNQADENPIRVLLDNRRFFEGYLLRDLKREEPELYEWIRQKKKWALQAEVLLQIWKEQNGS